MTIKIKTNEKQYGTSTDEYLDMLRRVHTYPGVVKITSVMYEDTIIEFKDFITSELFLQMEENRAGFTRI